jgi:hypothetical protein
MYRRPEIKLERTGEPTDSTGVSPIMYEVVFWTWIFEERVEKKPTVQCALVWYTLTS